MSISITPGVIEGDGMMPNLAIVVVTSIIAAVVLIVVVKKVL